jgi:hypothetical protein
VPRESRGARQKTLHLVRAVCKEQAHRHATRHATQRVGVVNERQTPESLACPGLPYLVHALDVLLRCGVVLRSPLKFWEVHAEWRWREPCVWVTFNLLLQQVLRNE